MLDDSTLNADICTTSLAFLRLILKKVHNVFPCYISSSKHLGSWANMTAALVVSQCHLHALLTSQVLRCATVLYITWKHVTEYIIIKIWNVIWIHMWRWSAILPPLCELLSHKHKFVILLLSLLVFADESSDSLQIPNTPSKKSKRKKSSFGSCKAQWGISQPIQGLPDS